MVVAPIDRCDFRPPGRLMPKVMPTQMNAGEPQRTIPFPSTSDVPFARRIHAWSAWPAPLSDAPAGSRGGARTAAGAGQRCSRGSSAAHIASRSSRAAGSGRATDGRASRFRLSRGLIHEVILRFVLTALRPVNVTLIIPSDRAMYGRPQNESTKEVNHGDREPERGSGHQALGGVQGQHPHTTEVIDGEGGFRTSSATAASSRDRVQRGPRSPRRPATAGRSGPWGTRARRRVRCAPHARHGRR